jgi:hypothetical protein
MKIFRYLTLAACLATAPTTAFAQTMAFAQPAPQPVAAVDPARLAAANALMDQIMPPATRNQMISSMMASMNQMMLQAFRQNPELSAAIEKEPDAGAVFERFMQRQQAFQTEQLTMNLPGMLDAMAHAYARRFSLSELHDIATFFATPSGQAYLVQAPTIMSDPDVTAWMGTLMKSSMQKMPNQIAELLADLKAMHGKKGATHGG